MGRNWQPRKVVADIITRFLSGSETYPQEFNAFIDRSLSNPKLDLYRKRCEILQCEFQPRRGEDPNQRAQREAAAVREFDRITTELRSLESH